MCIANLTQFARSLCLRIRTRRYGMIDILARADEQRQSKLPADPMLWTIPQVRQWLGDAGFGRHAPTFTEQEVDGAALLALKPSDLIDMGVAVRDSLMRRWLMGLSVVGGGSHGTVARRRTADQPARQGCLLAHRL